MEIFLDIKAQNFLVEKLKVVTCYYVIIQIKTEKMFLYQVLLVKHQNYFIVAALSFIAAMVIQGLQNTQSTLYLD